jgi:hypothetical protein
VKKSRVEGTNLGLMRCATVKTAPSRMQMPPTTTYAIPMNGFLPPMTVVVVMTMDFVPPKSETGKSVTGLAR